jgi:hypothetical protein
MPELAPMSGVPVPVFDPMPQTMPLDESQKSKLAQWQKEIAQGGLKVTLHEATGMVAEEILLQADSLNTDLIVMGTMDTVRCITCSWEARPTQHASSVTCARPSIQPSGQGSRKSLRCRCGMNEKRDDEVVELAATAIRRVGGMAGLGIILADFRRSLLRLSLAISIVVAVCSSFCCAGQ